MANGVAIQNYPYHNQSQERNSFQGRKRQHILSVEREQNLSKPLQVNQVNPNDLIPHYL